MVILKEKIPVSVPGAMPGPAMITPNRWQKKDRSLNVKGQRFRDDVLAVLVTKTVDVPYPDILIDLQASDPDFYGNASHNDVQFIVGELVKEGMVVEPGVQPQPAISP